MSTSTATTCAKLLAAVLLLSGLLACEPLGDFGSSGDSCNMSEGTAVLDGTWVIAGEGSRNSCDQARYEGDFSLGPSKGLQITHDPDDPTRLSLKQPIEGFELSGTVTGSCIDFETQESSSGVTLVRRYTGKTTAGGDITGTFTGDGPGDCFSSGSFTVTVD